MTETELLTHKTLAYSVTRRTCDLFFRLYFRRRVEGVENLPTEGGVVLAANHQSFLDIPFVAQATTRHVCFVARDTLARSRPMAWLMRRCGAVLVRRGASDRAALREMNEHLVRGDALAVFPEGTRTRDGRLGEFRRGALLVARKAGVPIVPVAIRGAYEAYPRGKLLPRPRRMSLRFGVPVDSAAADAQEQVLQAVLDMLGDGRYDSGPVTP